MPRVASSFNRERKFRLPRMEFDEAMLLLEKRLRSLGIEARMPPPEGERAG